MAPCSSSKRTIVETQTMPNDVLIEIFSQLPVCSLLRFQYLSKYWYDVMKSSFFIDNHLHRGGKSRRMLLMITRCLLPPEQDDVLSFHDLDNPDLEVRANFSISFMEALRTREWGGTLRLLGSCNGIVCIMHDGCVTLCNPALREFKLLPPLPLDCCLEDYYEIVFAAGFGISCSGEFKVVLMRQYRHSDSGKEPSGPIPYCLYTSGTDTWKHIDDSPAFPYLYLRTNELFFNGACHWIRTTSKHLFPIYILNFNMDTEVFGRLDLPDCLSRVFDDTISPMVYNECLAVVNHGRWAHKLGVVEIWVMGEYGVKESWTLQFIMRIPQLLKSPVLLLWMNEERISLETRDGQLISISLLTNETKTFQPREVIKSRMCALIYEESLVRLTQGKTLNEMVSLAKNDNTPIT